MTDEEMVRTAWDRAEICETVTGPDLKYCISLGGWGFTKACIPDGWAKTEAAAWAAAAEFTHERQEQIRQLQEEIFYSNCGPNAIPVCKRILARLEAELAKLQKGMK